MMRLTYGVAVLSTVAALAALPANAQLPAGNNNVMIKGGIYDAGKGPVKDTGKNWWVGGLEYTLGNPDAQKVSSIEGLFTSKSDTVKAPATLGVPSRYKILSLMFNRKIRAVGKEGVALGNVVFYGAGVGMHYVSVKVDDPNPGGEGSIDKKKAVAGANVFVGYDMAANFQLEAKYQFAFSKVEGRDISGLQLLVGIKF